MFQFLNPFDDLIPTLELVPDVHVPLQRPNISITANGDGTFAIIQYNATSPSLSGSYVLCSYGDEPLTCGGRISLTVTSNTSTLILNYFNHVYSTIHK